MGRVENLFLDSPLKLTSSQVAPRPVFRPFRQAFLFHLLDFARGLSTSGREYQGSNHNPYDEGDDHQENAGFPLSATTAVTEASKESLDAFPRSGNMFECTADIAVHCKRVPGGGGNVPDAGVANSFQCTVEPYDKPGHDTGEYHPQVPKIHRGFKGGIIQDAGVVGAQAQPDYQRHAVADDALNERRPKHRFDPRTLRKVPHPPDHSGIVGSDQNIQCNNRQQEHHFDFLQKVNVQKLQLLRCSHNSLFNYSIL